MKHNHLDHHVYLKKRRYKLIFVCVGFILTLLVVIGVVLMATGSFKQTDSLSAITLGVPQKDPVQKVNDKTVKDSDGFLITVPYISQEGDYPTACEVVSAVMLLSYYGYNITVDDFIDNYLPQAEIESDPLTGLLISKDPNDAFIGDPRNDEGYGCYAPVIVTSINKIVKDKAEAVNTTGVSLDNLIEIYIDNNTPVLLWASMNLMPTYQGNSWLIEDTGEYFTWIAGEHCMVLVGYDDDYYYFNDPYETNGIVKYDKQLVKQRWNELGEQSAVLIEN